MTTIISMAKVVGLRALSWAFALWLSPGGRVLVYGAAALLIALGAWWWWQDVKSGLVEQGRQQGQAALRTEIERANEQAEREANETRQRADRAARRVAPVPSGRGDLERLCEQDAACRDREAG